MDKIKNGQKIKDYYMEHKTDSLLTTKKELIFNKPIELNTFILNVLNIRDCIISTYDSKMIVISSITNSFSDQYISHLI